MNNITFPATGAHIHEAPKDKAGPVVVTLEPPNERGTSGGCVQADMALVNAIAATPGEYYVNVHTVDFPDGTVRGHLVLVTK